MNHKKNSRTFFFLNILFQNKFPISGTTVSTSTRQRSHKTLTTIKKIQRHISVSILWQPWWNKEKHSSRLKLLVLGYGRLCAGYTGDLSKIDRGRDTNTRLFERIGKSRRILKESDDLIVPESRSRRGCWSVKRYQQLRRFL